MGSFQFHIESYVCDFTGKATLPVMANFLLQAASIHAQQRGFGYEQISKDKVAWVLSRLSIEIDEYPGYDCDLMVETWVEAVSRYFTQRCFRFVDADNRTIGYARSIWAAIDMETRRPIDISLWRPDLADYIDAEKECPIEKMTKIPPVNQVDASMGYSVRYSDIDINKHMNSVKYIEHVTNLFDLSVYKEKEIHKFEIVYLAEGIFGDKLKLYKMPVSEDECLVDTKKNEESICRSRIIWRNGRTT
jgi:acyl-ACP thioesterase